MSKRTVKVLIEFEVDSECLDEELVDCVRCETDNFDYDFIKEETHAEVAVLSVRKVL